MDQEGERGKDAGEHQCGAQGSTHGDGRKVVLQGGEILCYGLGNSSKTN